jgi:hypothetical protein
MSMTKYLANQEVNKYLTPTIEKLIKQDSPSNVLLEDGSVIHWFEGCKKAEDEEGVIYGGLQSIVDFYNNLKNIIKNSDDWQVPRKRFCYTDLTYKEKRIFYGQFKGVFYEYDTDDLVVVFRDNDKFHTLFDHPILICKTPGLVRGDFYQIQHTGRFYHPTKSLHIFDIRKY